MAKLKLIWLVFLGLNLTSAFGQSGENVYAEEIKFLRTFLQLAPNGLDNSEYYKQDAVQLVQTFFNLEKKLNETFGTSQDFMQLPKGGFLEKVQIIPPQVEKKTHIKKAKLKEGALRNFFYYPKSTSIYDKDSWSYRFTLEGLLTGLIVSSDFPEEKLRYVWKLPVEAKIEWLEMNLHKQVELEKQGFRYQQYELPSSIKKDELILYLNNLLEKEKIILATIKEKINLNVRGQQYRVHDEAVFDYIRDQVIYEETLKGRLPLDEEQIKLARKYLLREIKNLYEYEWVDMSIPQNTLTLLRVPSRLSGLRGCIGTDCSTSHSYAYAYDQNETTFFIYSSTEPEKVSEAPLGHITGTWLTSQGKKTFYAHTINGATLDGQKAWLVISGIKKWAEQQGAAQTLIPLTNRLKENINFEGIRSTLESLVNANDFLPIEYTNPQLRSLLEEITPSTYDQMKSNTQGLKINEDVLVQVEIKTKLIQEQPVLEPLDLVSKIRIYKYFSPDWVNVDSFNYFATVMVRNIFYSLEKEHAVKHLNVAEYLQLMKDSFAKYGEVFDKRVIKKNLDLFFPALLTAPDAFSENYATEHVKYLFEYLKKSPLDGCGGASLHYPIRGGAFCMSENFEIRQLSDLDQKFQLTGPESFEAQAIKFLDKAGRTQVLRFIYILEDALVNMDLKNYPMLMKKIFEKLDVLEAEDLKKIIQMLGRQKESVHEKYIVELISYIGNRFPTEELKNFKWDFLNLVTKPIDEHRKYHSLELSLPDVIKFVLNHSTYEEAFKLLKETEYKGYGQL
ncbi:MAG: hypothetical protein JNM93_08040, partial [Bacteriovoracaceae bacterium]|nr:hypothetical protein [Bacteriovoracaceae bacterium]